MRIRKLEIYGFGKFVQKKIDLDSNLQVFYGENEAGKSTIYAFINAILFGMPVKHENKVDYEPRTANQYGGAITLLLDNGEEVVVERVKKVSSSKLLITFQDGRIGGEKALAEILENIDRDLFDRVFSFNLDALSEVYKLNENEVGRFLMHTGVTGSDKLRTIEDALLKDAGVLFKKGGSKPPINVKIKGLSTSSESLKSAKEKEDSYSKLLNAKVEVSNKIKELKSQILDIEDTSRNLIEQSNLRPLDVERKRLEKKVSELSNINFPSDGLLRMNELIAQESLFASNVQKYTAQMETLNTKLKAENVNEEALNYTNQVEESTNHLFRYNKLSEELVLLENKLNRMNSDIGDLASDIGLKLSEEQVSEMDLSINVKTRIENVCTQESRLVDNKARVSREIIELSGELSSLEQIQSEHVVHQNKNPFAFVSWMFVFVAAVLFLFDVTTVAVILSIVGIITFILSQKNPQKVEVSDNAKLEIIQAKLEAKYLEKVEIEKIENKLRAEKLNISNYFGMHTIAEGRALINVFEGLLMLRKLFSERVALESEFEKKYSNGVELKKSILQLANKIGVTQNLDLALVVSEMKLILENSKRSVINSENISNQINRLSDEVISDRLEVDRLKKEISDLLIFSEVDNVEAFKLLAEKNELLKEDRKNLEVIESKLNGITFDELSEIELQEKIEEKMHLLQLKTDELDDLRNKLAEISHSIYEVEEHGTVEDITQRHEQALELFNSEAREWMKLTLAKGIISKAVDEFKTLRLPSVVAKANDYLEFMTHGKYNQIVFSDEMGLNVMDSNGLTVRARDLSRGASELLYTSLKLAFVFSFKGQKLCPIILDDAFVNFDNQRSERVIELLNKISKEQQVIFFTCHEHLLEKFKSENVIILK